MTVSCGVHSKRLLLCRLRHDCLEQVLAGSCALHALPLFFGRPNECLRLSMDDAYAVDPCLSRPSSLLDICQGCTRPCGCRGTAGHCAQGCAINCCASVVCVCAAVKVAEMQFMCLSIHETWSGPPKPCTQHARYSPHHNNSDSAFCNRLAFCNRSLNYPWASNHLYMQHGLPCSGGSRPVEQISSTSCKLVLGFHSSAVCLKPGELMRHDHRCISVMLRMFTATSDNFIPPDALVETQAL